MSRFQRFLTFVGLGPEEEYEDFYYDESPQYADQADHPVESSPYHGEPLKSSSSEMSQTYGQIHVIETHRPSEAGSLQTRQQLEPDAGMASISNVRKLPSTVPAEPIMLFPITFNDCQEIGDSFRARVPTFINIESVAEDTKRRILDFASGICYALDGKMQKVSRSGVYLMMPQGVELSTEDLTQYLVAHTN